MKPPLAALLLLMLSACGFAPVHGARETHQLNAALPAIDVTADRSRLGQLLQAEIEDHLNPSRLLAAAQYRLNIAVNEQLIPLFINNDGTASRGDIRFVSTYALTRIRDGKVIDTGTIERVSSFNSSEQADYATFLVQQDARQRGIMELAEDYNLRLSNLHSKLTP